MQAVLVQSGGKTACYISDLIPTSPHLDLNWVMALICIRSRPSTAAGVTTPGPAGEVAYDVYPRRDTAVGLCGKR